MNYFKPSDEVSELMKKIMPYAVFTAWASLIAIFVVKTYPETAKYFAEAIGLSAFTCYFEALKCFIKGYGDENEDYAIPFARMTIACLLAFLALILFWLMIFKGLVWPIKYIFKKAFGSRT